MCLAVPARLVECDPRIARAVADLHGNRVAISTALTPDAGVGDWVLVHAGFAIRQVDCDEAAETWALIRDVLDAPETTPAQAPSVAGGEQ
jgi:hydrogenase expression/formation protein HypC